MSEEKKLTDEEMLNRLELYARDGIWWDGIVEMHDILDLIHRLQNNYSNLKEKYVKMLDLNERTLTKQQAEIERLAKVEMDLISKIADKSAEIERLKIQKDKEQLYKDEFQDKCVALKLENAELQKQVDELKSENTELYKEHTALIAGSILKQQDLAKDTAKEILQEIFSICKDAKEKLDCMYGNKKTSFGEGYKNSVTHFTENILKIAREKGIEVE